VKRVKGYEMGFVTNRGKKSRRCFTFCDPNFDAEDGRVELWRNISVSIVGRVACEVCSEMWNVGTNSEFHIGPKENHGKTFLELANRRTFLIHLTNI
jgi:hypothetical protein